MTVPCACGSTDARWRGPLGLRVYCCDRCWLRLERRAEQLQEEIARLEEKRESVKAEIVRYEGQPGTSLIPIRHIRK